MVSEGTQRWGFPEDDVRLLESPLCLLVAGAERQCGSLRELEGVLSHQVRYSACLDGTALSDVAVLTDEYHRLGELLDKLDAGKLSLRAPELEEIVFSPCAIQAEWAVIISTVLTEPGLFDEARILAFYKYRRFVAVRLQRLGQDAKQSSEALDLESSMTLQAPLNLEDPLQAPDLVLERGLVEPDWSAPASPLTRLPGHPFDDDTQTDRPVELDELEETALDHEAEWPALDFLPQDETWAESQRIDEALNFADPLESQAESEPSMTLGLEPLHRAEAVPAADSHPADHEGGASTEWQLEERIWAETSEQQPLPLPRSETAEGATWGSGEPPYVSTRDRWLTDLNSAQRPEGETVPVGNGWARLPRGMDVRLQLGVRKSVEIMLADHRFKLRFSSRPKLIDPARRVYFLNEGANLVGRAPENDTVVNPVFDSISRVHLHIEISNGRLRLVRDMSGHGTFVPEFIL